VFFPASGTSFVMNLDVDTGELLRQRRSERLVVHNELVALISEHKGLLLFDSESKVGGV
jgi:hypothetical protein